MTGSGQIWSAPPRASGAHTSSIETSKAGLELQAQRRPGTIGSDSSSSRSSKHRPMGAAHRLGLAGRARGENRVGELLGRGDFAFVAPGIRRTLTPCPLSPRTGKGGRTLLRGASPLGLPILGGKQFLRGARGNPLHWILPLSFQERGVSEVPPTAMSSQDAARVEFGRRGGQHHGALAIFQHVGEAGRRQVGLERHEIAAGAQHRQLGDNRFERPFGDDRHRGFGPDAGGGQTGGDAGRWRPPASL